MAEEKNGAAEVAPKAASKTAGAAKAAPKAKAASTETTTAAAKAPKATAAKASASTDEAPKAAKAAKAPATTAAAADSSSETVTAPKAAKAKAEPAEAREQVLKVHHLRPAAGSKKARTRVGRGEGSKGKTAGRGTKGTKARYNVRLGFEGGQMPQHMRTPKLRGFKNPFKIEYQVVNLDRLAELYPTGGEVTIADLVSKGAVRDNEKVKVLGNGDIAVKLNVTVDKVSGSAEQKIVAAGGSVK
ncbi:50S ribosomal protein L15 [Subtercola sp. YIM 133946]|uniref:50S ribosomal protein L15 n=1 Tax=Subtercola sp. YIM 133946 TaxID=3118909 RepID=UPI002F9434DE